VTGKVLQVTDNANLGRLSEWAEFEDTRIVDEHIWSAESLLRNMVVWGGKEVSAYRGVGVSAWALEKWQSFLLRWVPPQAEEGLLRNFMLVGTSSVSS
jgi:hypothetical protein